MKVLHCMSSGQDSTLSLYNLLKNTDHEVVAWYGRYTHFFSKNHLDFCQYYIEEIVHWLKTNVRDFQFRIERAPSPTWSFYLPPEHRIYDDVVTKEILEKYWNDELQGGITRSADNMMGKTRGAWVLERFYGHYWMMNEINKHSKNKIAWVQTGSDRMQCGPFGLYPPMLRFWNDLNPAGELRAPLSEENLGRVAIYDALPNGLKKAFNQCDVTERNGENWCGECLRCLTRKVHESGMSVEETEKIFTKNSLELESNKWSVDNPNNDKKVLSIRDYYGNNLRKMLQIQRERNKKRI